MICERVKTVKGSYKLAWILRDVARMVKASGDGSATTIRCAINDALDYWSKGGFKVRLDYNQTKAIATVKRMVGEL